jgi:hypothetical protein
MSPSRKAEQKPSRARYGAVLIFLVIFAVLSFVLYELTYKNYPLWEIIAVIIALWLVFLLIVYFITHFGEASLYPGVSVLDKKRDR